MRFSGRSVSATSPLTTNAAPAVIASPISVQSVSVVAPTSCVPPAPRRPPRTSDRTAGRRVDGRDEHGGHDRLEHEERDSEDDEDAVHGSSAADEVAGQLALRDEAAGAGGGDELAVVRHVSARDEDDVRQRAVAALERYADVEAGHVGQLDVEHHDVGGE